jgi:hypothetical protein
MSWEELFAEIDRDDPQTRARARGQDPAQLPPGMIILDASAVVDLLVEPAAQTRELRARIRRASRVYAPT